MAISVHLILIVFAIVLFAVAAAGVRHPRYDLIALGLAFWALASIVTA